MRVWTSNWIAAVAVLWAVVPTSATGQSELNPGDRIRVQERDGAVVTGTVTEVSADQVLLLTFLREYSVSRDQIESLDRSLGEKRNFAGNFALSVAGTAVVGGVLGAVTWSPCTETGFLACFLYPESRTDAFGFGLAIGGIVGVPIGLIVGLASKHEVSEPISVPGPSGFALRIQPVVRADLLGLTASIPMGGF